MTAEGIKFSEVLKKETAERHLQLEGVEISKAIIGPALTKDLYVEYLQRMYSFIAAFEATHFNSLKPVIIDIESRQKEKALHNDIATVSGKPPLALRVPLIANNLSVAWLLGALYVLEGSTLGGRFLYKNANQVLGLNEQTGAGYFYGYGPETGKKWVSFLEAFNDYAAHKPALQPQMIEGANATFEIFFNVLNKPI